MDRLPCDVEKKRRRLIRVVVDAQELEHALRVDIGGVVTILAIPEADTDCGVAVHKIAEAAVVHRGDAERVVAVVRLLVSVVAQKGLEAPAMRQVRVAEMTQVPLAHHMRHIASLAEDLWHELMLQSEAVLRIDQKAADSVASHPHFVRVATSHECGPGGSTRRRGVVRGERHAGSGESIHRRSRGWAGVELQGRGQVRVGGA
mmetsp:Transcript_12097/g.32717  ORF Transcript_12097/g.32717 Transcript_12097/m.32717 type:complete len:203 (-) Transcript_12097:567-1175(-)